MRNLIIALLITGSLPTIALAHLADRTPCKWGMGCAEGKGICIQVVRPDAKEGDTNIYEEYGLCAYGEYGDTFNKGSASDITETHCEQDVDCGRGMFCGSSKAHPIGRCRVRLN